MVVFAWHAFHDEATQGANEAGADLVAVAPGEFDNLLQQKADPDPRGRPGRGRPHRRPPLSLRHDRQPEGRGAHPLKPQAQRRGDPGDADPDR